MIQITFVTSNAAKLAGARRVCETFDIQIEQAVLDIVEPQAEEGEPIARDKAQKAYDILRQPLVVTDDSWVIPGLKGFPGPYMKSINHWFSPQNWLDLTASLTDRTVILRQIAIYQDERGQRLFSYDIQGELLHDIRGPEVKGSSNECIISFNGDGRSMAETRAAGHVTIGNHRTVWHTFAPWLQEQSA